MSTPQIADRFGHATSQKVKLDQELGQLLQLTFRYRWYRPSQAVAVEVQVSQKGRVGIFRWNGPRQRIVRKIGYPKSGNGKEAVGDAPFKVGVRNIEKVKLLVVFKDVRYGSRQKVIVDNESLCNLR